MCIAIVKPLGVELPSKERLKICFDNNPHSIGIGSLYNGLNYKLISKFTSFESFYMIAKNKITKDHIAFIHFRYATHGEINLDNCHPFFISNTQKNVQKAPMLMHNGVFQLGKLENNKSDTVTLVEKMYSENLELDNELITKSNNKIAIMKNNCEFDLYGNWIYEEDGCIYSNGSYRKSVEEYKVKFNNPNLMFCDCCGEIGESYLTTEVGYHFCNNCIENKKVYMYNCSECGKLCADKICSDCSEEKNISLKYWK